MIVSVFVMFGIGYFLGGGMSSNETTVSGENVDNHVEDKSLQPLLTNH